MTNVSRALDRDGTDYCPKSDDFAYRAGVGCAVSGVAAATVGGLAAAAGLLPPVGLAVALGAAVGALGCSLGALARSMSLASNRAVLEERLTPMFDESDAFDHSRAPSRRLIEGPSYGTPFQARDLNGVAEAIKGVLATEVHEQHLEAVANWFAAKRCRESYDFLGARTYLGRVRVNHLLREMRTDFIDERASVIEVCEALDRLAQRAGDKVPFTNDGSAHFWGLIAECTAISRDQDNLRDIRCVFNAAPGERSAEALYWFARYVLEDAKDTGSITPAYFECYIAAIRRGDSSSEGRSAAIRRVQFINRRAKQRGKEGDYGMALALNSLPHSIDAYLASLGADVE